MRTLQTSPSTEECKLQGSATASETLQPCYESGWQQIAEDSTSWRSAWDKMKKKAPPKKTLDRENKGRLWNLGYDNNTSI